jgi:small glutamine-rich tetratricopeptide repeat-containing protein alpha
LGNHQKASACYRKAVELEPNNESYANNLKVSEEVLAGGDQAGAAGGPQVSLQTLFNNPSLISMATQMLQDPNMQSM